MVIPSGNVGEVSCAQASSEEFTLIAIKSFYREVSFLKGKRVCAQEKINHTQVNDYSSMLAN